MTPEIPLYYKGGAGQYKAHDLGGIPGAENIRPALTGNFDCLYTV